MLRFMILAALVAAAVAQTKPVPAPCKPNGKPAIPTAITVAENKYDPSSKWTKITLSWTNPTRPDDGCTDFYRVSRIRDGASVAEDGPIISSPTQTPVTHTFSVKPGDSLKTKLWAVNKPSQKTSEKVDGPWIKAAEAPPEPCKADGIPKPPANIKLVDNKYDAAAGYSKITLQWDVIGTPADGCASFFRVQRLKNGAAVAEDGPQVMPTQKMVTYTFPTNPGETFKTQLWAVNQANQKSSAKVAGPTITAVDKPRPQPKGL